MPLPNLIGIGVQRAGTNTLWSALMGQPDITGFRSSSVGFEFQRESHFFDSPDWRQKTKAYKIAFTQEPIRIDFTPSYMYFATVPGRVKELCPKARFLVLLRDPVERAISSYGLKMTKGRQRVKRSFTQIVTDEMAKNGDYFERLLAGEVRWKSRKRYNPVRTGLYAAQLKHWLEYFPAHRFFVVDGTWFFTSQEETVRRIKLFMGVKSKLEEVQDLHKNMSDKGWMIAENMHVVRNRLQEFYDRWNFECYRLLNEMKRDGATVLSALA